MNPSPGAGLWLPPAPQAVGSRSTNFFHAFPPADRLLCRKIRDWAGRTTRFARRHQAAKLKRNPSEPLCGGGRVRPVASRAQGRYESKWDHAFSHSGSRSFGEKRRSQFAVP